MQIPLFAATFWPPEQVAQSWKDVAELAILCVAAVFGLVQLALLRRQQADSQRQSEDESRNERHRRTIEINLQLAGPIFKSKRDAVEAIVSPTHWPDQAIPIETLDEEFKKHPNLEDNLSAMLGYLETMAVPVYACATDERMQYELYGGTAIWYAVAFRNYILRKQALVKRPDLYIYMLKLAERWQKVCKKEQNLPPFYLRKTLCSMGE